MSASENKAILIGRAYDIRKSTTNSGTSAVSFNLSIEEKLGEKKNYSSLWVNCYSGLADIVDRFWGDGRLVYVEGRIHQFDDPNGGSKYSIMAKNVKFLGSIDQ